jgi:hypothetical protein
LKPKQSRFLTVFEVSCCVGSAARAAGITRKTHYDWLQRDPAYATAFETARRVAADVLEGELIQRATAGWLEPIFYQGRQCGSVRRFSDAAAMFLLKHLMPEKFGRA